MRSGCAIRGTGGCGGAPTKEPYKHSFQKIKSQKTDYLIVFLPVSG